MGQDLFDIKYSSFNAALLLSLHAADTTCPRSLAPTFTVIYHIKLGQDFLDIPYAAIIDICPSPDIDRSTGHETKWTTMEYTWFLYQMVAQNILRASEGKHFQRISHMGPITDLKKCLNRLNYRFYYTYFAPISELPSNISTTSFICPFIKAGSQRSPSLQ